jgi:hypothetical protein
MKTRALILALGIAVAVLASLWWRRTHSTRAPITGVREVSAQDAGGPATIAPVVEEVVTPPSESPDPSTVNPQAATPEVPVETGLSISGRVTSRTGTLDLRQAERPFEVDLSRWERDPSSVGSATVHWEREADGRLEGSFLFVNLAPGEYRLDPDCPGFLEVEPDVIVTRAPRTDIVFVIEDEAGWSDLSVEVVDDETGAPIEQYYVEVGSRHSNSSRMFASFLPRREPGLFAEWWPNDLDGTWRVSSEGYLTVEGSVSELIPVRAGERPRRTTQVRMVRGTDIVFVCRAQATDGRSPLADVVVYLDGVRAGVSDEEGQAFTQFAGVPRTVRFEKPGWKLASAPRIPVETGLLSDPPDREYYVVFEPTEK